MLTLAVNPGRSVGAFTLGSGIRDVVEMLRQSYAAVPRAEVKYNASAPLNDALLLQLPTNGVVLRFEPFSQRLAAVELYKPRSVTLVYGDTVFCSPDVAPTLALIHDAFGPSHPGAFDGARGVYVLEYPGIVFTFGVPPLLAGAVSHNQDLPMKFADGSSPVASRIEVSIAEVVDDAGDGGGGGGGGEDVGALGRRKRRRVVVLPSLPQGSRMFERVDVLPGEGVQLNSRLSAPKITFSSGMQTLLAVLGKPEHIFEKHEDRLRIHHQAVATVNAHGVYTVSATPTISSSGGGDGDTGGATGGGGSGGGGGGGVGVGARADSDYFVCYFRSGMAFLLHGSTHTVRKIVLFSNFVCHAQFNRFAKCNWHIRTGSATVGADTKWAAVRAAMGDTGKPFVYSEKGSPFAPSHFYAYDGCIFEVLSNSHIATVTLFATPVQ